MKVLVLITVSGLLLTGCTQPTQAPQSSQQVEAETADDPVDITDLDYQGLPVRIGVQGKEALPVQAVIETERDLPVALHMAPDQKLPVQLEMKEAQSLPIQVGAAGDGMLPVEIKTINDAPIDVNIQTEDARPLQVAFGLPPIPHQAILPLAVAGAGLFLLILLPCIAAVAAMKAAQRTRQIAELLLTQTNNEPDNASTPGLLAGPMDDQPNN